MEASVFFDQKPYNSKSNEKATKHHDYFIYYSTTQGEPMGFSQTADIHINIIECFECFNGGDGFVTKSEKLDKHRLSVATDGEWSIFS